MKIYVRTIYPSDESPDLFFAEYFSTIESAKTYNLDDFDLDYIEWKLFGSIWTTELDNIERQRFFIQIFERDLLNLVNLE